MPVMSSVPLRLRAACLVFGLSMLLVCSVRAQPRSSPSSQKPQIAEVLPAEAGLIVVVPRLNDLDGVLKRTGLYQLLPALAGRSASLADAADLRRAVAGLTGVTRNPMLDRLMECEAAYVATSWSDLSGATLVIRLKEEAWFNEWFPPNTRIGARRQDRTLMFETAALRVAMRDRTVVLTRKGALGSWFERVVELLQAKKPSGWADEQTYRKSIGAASSSPLLLVGLNVPSGFGGEAADATLWGFRHLTACVREADGRLDVDVRARPAPSVRSGSGSRAADVVRRLPSTTLAAWATTLNLNATVRAWLTNAKTTAAGNRPLDWWSRALPLYSEVEQLLPMLGERAVLVWGQPDARQPHLPQLGMFIECSDAAEAVRKLREMLALGTSSTGFRVEPIGDGEGVEPPDEGRGAVMPAPDAAPKDDHGVGEENRRIMSARGTGDASPFRVEVHQRYGVSLTSVVPGVAENDEVAMGSSSSGFRPSFAAMDGWLIVTLSDEHLVSLIEAHHGIRSSLGSVRDVADLQERPGRSGTVVVLQPALAAGVLNGWLTAYQNGRPSPFDISIWVGNTRTVSRIGVEIEDVPTPGSVRVASVQAGGPAEGLIEVGDRVLGVDGQVLSVHETEQDLRRRIAQSRRIRGLLLRIERQGELKDVELPIPAPESVSSFERAMPMLRRLAQVGGRVETACLTTWSVAGDEIAARLSIRMSPPASP